ncbi:MAG: HEAT repeat domain-containing protein [Alphaproteobacteria bacterium]|nr:HEAT repeat domain-containing protein [Alphaproteobacteria bacterium]
MIDKSSSTPDLSALDLTELIDMALALFLDHVHAGTDVPDLPPPGWDAMEEIHRRADVLTLAAAILLCKSADARRKQLGASVLGHLGRSPDNPGGVFREERYQALKAFLAMEITTATKPGIVCAVCCALADLKDPSATALVLTLIDHSSTAVRLGVAVALSRIRDAAAIDGLLRLTADPDCVIRNWATASFARIDADTAPIRAALHARLADKLPVIRHVAIDALAQRRDRTVLPFLRHELTGKATSLLFDAASKLGDPSLCPALRSARARMLSTPLFDRRLRPCWDHNWLKAMIACGCPIDQDICLPD